MIALSSDLVWALVAGTAGSVLRRSRAFLRVQRYVSGSVFIGLGVLAALTGAPEVVELGYAASRPEALPLAGSDTAVASRVRFASYSAWSAS